jgi:uncharacterized protein (DUF1810 family)
MPAGLAGSRHLRLPAMTAADPFDDLERFFTAEASVFSTVLAELRAGRKRSQWMWFVFSEPGAGTFADQVALELPECAPQLRGLGRSAMATFYGIGYLAHPVLGPRLELCTKTVLELETGSLHKMFGFTA